jgi:hypothetical protein
MTATRPPGYDDRSAAPVEASRRGAHRARPKAIAAILPVVAGVAVVLLVIGAVYTVVGGRSSGSSSSSGETVEEAADPSVPADAGAGGADAGSDEESADAESPAAEESAGTGNGGGSKVDKSIPVVVLNSLNVQGLATQYQEKLEGKGWTVADTDNATSRDLAVTKIYYQDEDMKPSANAVRKALGGGIGEIAEDPDVRPGNITVVLGQDTQ